MIKKRGEVTKTILSYLLFAGLFAVAATSPYFVNNLFRAIARDRQRKIIKGDQKKYYDVFYSLKKRGLVDIVSENGQIYISLTEEGKKKAGKYQIDDLYIKKPKKWDQKWRILMFDIEEQHRAKREALRGKIKQLGLYKLQRSVWVCPYECMGEINFLRDFFNLNKKEMTVITADEIEDSFKIKQFFSLNN